VVPSDSNATSHRATPTFFLAGVPRAGTTSLASYLAQHPQVYLPAVKEPCFFIHPAEYARGADYYLDTFFAAAAGATAIGDASTQYLLDPRCAQRIHELCGRPRFVVIFREPVERAYSYYWWAVRNEIETASFEEGLALEEQRTRQAIAAGGAWWERAYLQAGRYATNLAPFLERFGRDRFLLLRYEDLAEPERVCRRIFRFLEVDADQAVDTSRRLNASSRPRIAGVQGWIRDDSRLKRAFKTWVPAGARRGVKRAVEAANLVTAEYPPMRADTRRDLAARLRGEIVELMRIGELELRHWLEQPSADDASS